MALADNVAAVQATWGYDQCSIIKPLPGNRLVGRSVVRAGATRCPQCSLPPRWCICDTLPPVLAGLDVHVLIHRHEHRKPSSTGRLIARAIPESTIHVYQRAHGDVPASGFQIEKLEPGSACWILHPDGDPLPHAASASQQPTSILLLDGTWKQAHEMLRSVETVGRCIRLSDDVMHEPSRYWLRDQPGPSQLCTAEALMAVLNAVGDTEASRLLRLHFELHVYATLLSRGKREMAERYLGHSPLRSEASDIFHRLHARWAKAR